MTLNAQAALTTAMQKMLEHASLVGIVTGNTIHRLAIAWVGGLVTHRMREAFVLIVTVVTDVMPIFQHRRAVAAVPEVAI